MTTGLNPAGTAQDPADFTSGATPSPEPSGHGDDAGNGGSKQPALTPELQALVDAEVEKRVATEVAAKARDIANRNTAQYQSQAAQERARADREAKHRQELEAKLREHLGPEEIEVLERLVVEQGKKELAEERQTREQADLQMRAQQQMQAEALQVHETRVAHLGELGLRADDPDVQKIFNESYDGTKWKTWAESEAFFGKEIAKLVKDRAAGSGGTRRQPRDPAQPVTGTPTNGVARPDFYGDPSELYAAAAAERRRQYS